MTSYFTIFKKFNLVFCKDIKHGSSWVSVPHDYPFFPCVCPFVQVTVVHVSHTSPLSRASYLRATVDRRPLVPVSPTPPLPSPLPLSVYSIPFIHFTNSFIYTTPIVLGPKNDVIVHKWLSYPPPMSLGT